MPSFNWSVTFEAFGRRSDISARDVSALYFTTPTKACKISLFCIVHSFILKKNYIPRVHETMKFSSIRKSNDKFNLKYICIRAFLNFVIIY